jgi:hypothetical protein
MIFFFILPFAATAFYFVMDIAARAIWAAFEAAL